MILDGFFKRRSAGLKALAREERPEVTSLLGRYPDAKAYETHHDNIYKALVLMLPGYDLDASSGWQGVPSPRDAARIADEMTGYPGTDRGSWKAVVNENDELAGLILTAVPGGFVGFEGNMLKLDATHYQFTGEPEGGRGGA